MKQYNTIKLDISDYGAMHWRCYQNNTSDIICHRTAGPAVKFINGDTAWVIYGRLHRLDGPAVEWGNDGKEWWIDDIRYYTELEYWLAAHTYSQTHPT